MILKIHSLNGILYEEKIKNGSVYVPAFSGDMEILAGHSPILTFLKKGDVVVKKEDGEKEIFPVNSGILECNTKEINILI